jgi:mannose/fructose-specific phosphotransferase system component IIA
MIHVYLCMHTPLLEGFSELVEQLNKTPLEATCVPHDLAETESELYKRLHELTKALPESDGVLVIGELLGARSATIALTLPFPNVCFLGGVNLPMLLSLNSTLKALEREPQRGALEALSWCSERLKRAAQGAVEDSQSLLRVEGEESMIDASFYEGSVFGLSAQALSES